LAPSQPNRCHELLREVRHCSDPSEQANRCDKTDKPKKARLQNRAT